MNIRILCCYWTMLCWAGFANSQDISSLVPYDTKLQIYGSKGFEQRGETIEALISDYKAFYQHEYPDILSDIRILILSKLDWTNSFKDVPYGIPYYDGIQNILIPADKFAAAVELGYEDLSTDQEISEYDKHIISVLSGAYIQKTTQGQIPEIWIQDWIANYFAVLFFEVNDFIWSYENINKEDVHFHTLEDYDRMKFEMSGSNYYWFQSKFIELASIISQDGGFQFLNDVLNCYKNNIQVACLELTIPKTSNTDFQEWRSKMK